MFGAISVDDDAAGAPAAQPGDIDEVARLEREGLRPDRARGPRPRREADEDRLRHVAVHVHVRRHDDQDRERRDHEHHVREHVQQVVKPAAAVTRREADARAEHPRDAAADDADEERRTQTVDELREDVLAERRRAEPVVPRWRRVLRAREVERPVGGDHRPDDGEHEERQHDPEPHDELPVAEGEVDELRSTSGSRRRNGCARTLGGDRRNGVGRGGRPGRRHDSDLALRDSHQAPPCMPMRVRGSMKTYVMSMMKFAISTPTIRNRKIPWIRK